MLYLKEERFALCCDSLCLMEEYGFTTLKYTVVSLSEVIAMLKVYPM